VNVNYAVQAGATILVTASSALNYTSGFTPITTNASFSNALLYTGPTVPAATPDTITYTAVATLNGCASAPSVFKVIVYPLPGVSLNYLSLQAICSGDTAKVTFTGGSSYLYTVITNTGVTGAASGSNPNLSQKLVNTSTRKALVQWEVRALNALGCAGAVDTVSIEVLAQMTPYLIQGPDSVCSGESFTLRGPAFDTTGRPRYQWLMSNTGPSGPFVPVVGATDSDLVETLVTDKWYRRVSFGLQGQCPELSPVKKVTLFPGVQTNAILGSQTLCANALTQLNALVGPAIYPANSTIQWEVSNDLGATWEAIIGADAPSYSVDLTLLGFPTGLGQSVETRFRRCISAHGCAPDCSNEVLIVIKSAPRPITFTLPSPTADSACAGSKGVHVAIETQAGAFYRWSSNPPGAAINGITSPVAVVDIPLGASSFVMICTLRDPITGCIRIDSLALPLRQLNVLPPGQVSLASGNTLSYLGPRPPGTNFQWGYDDLSTFLPSEIPGATSWNYVAGPLFNPTDLAYWVRVDDGECSTLAYYNRPTTDVTLGLEDPLARGTLMAPLVFPNPSQAGGSIRLALSEGPLASVTVHDFLGRRLRLPQTKFSGGQTHELALGLTSGLYVMQVSQGGQTRALKLVVE
jgi:hypothetical protein